MAGCTIQYLKEKVVHTAVAPTLEKATEAARANFSEVKRLYGATGYRISDSSHKCLSHPREEETM